MPRESFTFEGKRYYVRGANDRDIAVKIALKKKELEEGSIIIRQNTLVSVWSKEWLETYKKNSISAITYEGYLSRLNCHILPYIGNLKLKEVKPIHCQKIMNTLAGNSKTFIGKVENTMIQMFDKATKNKLILKNPASDLESPKATDGNRRALTDTEKFYLLEVCKANRANIWIKLMLYCGLRPDETSLVYGRHIKNKTLHIEGTKTPAANRIVPIPGEFYDELLALKIGPFEPIVKNSIGGVISKGNRRIMWNNVKREMNIAMGCKVYRNEIVKPLRVSPDLVPYCLRHTYCTDLQAAGVPINVAKELMGHTNISVTAKIYTHKSEIAFNSAAELIDKFHSVPNTVPHKAQTTGK